MRFTGAGHRAGYSTADLEERVLALADCLGIEGAQISVTPTIVELSCGPLASQHNFTLRVRPTPVDLDAIARLDELVSAILAGETDTETAVMRLEEIEAHPLQRHRYVRLAAYALAGAAVAPVLGGGRNELIAAAIVGLLVGAIALPAESFARTEPMIAPLAAVAVSFAAATLDRFWFTAAPDVVTLAALVTFLPGMALAVGMRELATEHLQSGVANTASALAQLLGLVFGVGVGRSVAASWFGVPHQAPPPTGFTGTHLLAALAAGAAFTVTLRAPTRAAPVMCSAAVLAIVANALGRVLVGPEAGVFFAALTIGIVGAMISIPLRWPPLVFIVPGILILVPGSAGFNSLLKLLTGQTVSAIDAGFNTFVTAMSIAYGLMLSTVILPRRFTQLGSRRR